LHCTLLSIANSPNQDSLSNETPKTIDEVIISFQQTNKQTTIKNIGSSFKRDY